jgi:hypothetical protein
MTNQKSFSAFHFKWPFLFIDTQCQKHWWLGAHLL